MAEEKVQSSAVAPESPAQARDRTLAEQYAHLSEEAQPAESTLGPVAEQDVGDPSPTPASRDPETGRFLSKTEAPKHPATLLRQAHDLGMADEDIADLSTQELRAEIRESKRAQGLEQLLRQHFVTPAREPAQQAPVSAPEVDALSELGDEFDPRIVKALKLIQEDNRRLKEQMAQILQHSQNQFRQTLTQRADACFAKRADLFGEGAGADLDPSSREYRRRMAVLGEMDQIKQGSFEQKYQKAVGILFEDAPAPKAKEKPATNGTGPTREEWEEGALAVPTQRNGAAEPNGPAKAKRAVREILREAGLSGGNTSIEEFPD